MAQHLIIVSVYVPKLARGPDLPLYGSPSIIMPSPSPQVTFRKSRLCFALPGTWYVYSPKAEARVSLSISGNALSVRNVAKALAKN